MILKKKKKTVFRLFILVIFKLGDTYYKIINESGKLSFSFSVDIQNQLFSPKAYFWEKNIFILFYANFMQIWDTLTTSFKKFDI